MLIGAGLRENRQPEHEISPPNLRIALTKLSLKLQQQAVVPVGALARGRLGCELLAVC